VSEKTLRIEGSAIQVDPSGKGHAWQTADEDTCPANIQAEIAAEIIDGGRTDCAEYFGSNGMSYRW
jgi:hypothetical protein